MSTAPTLADWLNNLPAPDGVRPLDRLPARTRQSPQRARYRRDAPPGGGGLAAPPQEIFSLVREAGVLRWRAGSVASAGARPRAGRAALPVGEVVKQYAFERLEGSQVYRALEGLDRMLTPMTAAAGGTGLRRLRMDSSGNFRLEDFPDAGKAAGKKILLFVHGTFSQSEALIERGLAKTPAGRKLLADAVSRYALVLCYDHPTLGVSPLLNAFDLAALLRPSPASIDIVCHSRGGLVARWFCEAYADPAVPRRVVFVGAPLAGTSLASAPRLKSALDLLTNIAEALRAASDLAAANAFFTAASGLLRVISTVTNTVANTMLKAPLLDAAIALVPGLDAMSRTGNNPEINRLRANTGGADFTSGALRYFAVQSNFEPRELGWNFLRLFSKPMQRLGDWAADQVFEGPNDLIVDTGSMAETADARFITIAHDFGTNERVHHTNYFEQGETLKAIRSSFALKLS